MAKLKEKHRREVNELKRQLTEKEGEVSQLKAFSKEREEASSALADELKAVRRDAREKETKLKETLQEEVRRTEKQLSREKILAVAKVQESIQSQRQKDLIELKEKLLEDKQLALTETKKKYSTALEDLTRKNQVCCVCSVRCAVCVWMHTIGLFVVVICVHSVHNVQWSGKPFCSYC